MKKYMIIIQDFNFKKNCWELVELINTDKIDDALIERLLHHYEGNTLSVAKLDNERDRHCIVYKGPISDELVVAAKIINNNLKENTTVIKQLIDEYLNKQYENRNDHHRTFDKSVFYRAIYDKILNLNETQNIVANEYKNEDILEMAKLVILEESIILAPNFEYNELYSHFDFIKEVENYEIMKLVKMTKSYIDKKINSLETEKENNENNSLIKLITKLLDQLYHDCVPEDDEIKTQSKLSLSRMYKELYDNMNNLVALQS